MRVQVGEVFKYFARTAVNLAARTGHFREFTAFSKDLYLRSEEFHHDRQGSAFSLVLFIRPENMIYFMSYIEVDQSGKVEQLRLDTVVALSNDKKYSVLLPKSVKSNLFIEYKGKIKNLKYRLFSILLFYGLVEFIGDDLKTVICREYTGKDMMLKSELFRLLRSKSIHIDPKTVSFNIITKNSPAHELAISVLRKQNKPDLILSKKHVENLLK
jgi:hypothetical protein